MYPAINIYNKAPTKLDITVSLKPLPYQSDFFKLHFKDHNGSSWLSGSSSWGLMPPANKLCFLSKSSLEILPFLDPFTFGVKLLASGTSAVRSESELMGTWVSLFVRSAGGGGVLGLAGVTFHSIFAAPENNSSSISQMDMKFLAEKKQNRKMIGT
jgi:hypothetical protein